jgi:hypothetical protein
MAERDTKGEVVTKGEAGAGGDIDQLRQGLDDLRGSVASLTARLGEGALAAGQQARRVAGEVAGDVADRAGEGVATLRARIEEQPLATAALAFFAGVALAGLVMGALIAAGSDGRPRRRQGGAEVGRSGGPRRHR